MAADIFERKVYSVGAWKGDIVTDAVIQNLRSKTEIEKGKKVKLSLSRIGLQVRKPSMFQGSSLLDGYKVDDVFFVTTDQKNKVYLLCIVKDTKYKYAILSFRCLCELDAGVFVHNFKELKSRNQNNNFVMKRNTDGNWTLRNGSGTSTRPQLSVVTKTANGSANGSIPHPDVYRAKASQMTEVPNLNNNGVAHCEKASVGVQIRSQEMNSDGLSDSTEVSSFKHEIDHLSHELKDIKLLLEKTTGSGDEHHMRKGQADHVNNNYINGNHVTRNANLNVDQDGTARVYVSHRPPPTLVPNPVPIHVTPDGQRVFRARYIRSSVPGVQKRSSNSAKGAEMAKILKREFSNNGEKAPRVITVPEPRMINQDVADGNNNNGVPENDITNGTVSGRSSLRVKFEPQAMRVNKETRSRSMRMRSDFMVPSTVERPIEKTYARPTILTQGGFKLDTHRRHVRRARPQSVYVVSNGQPMKAQHPRIAYEAQF